MKMRRLVILGIVIFLLVVFLSIITFALLFRSNMVLSKQPELTKFEIQYFNILENNCNCSVQREVDSQAKTDSMVFNKGWYLLKFDGVPLSVLKSKDSLRNFAEDVAKALHNKVLVEDFKYDYKEISISFISKTSKMSNVSESFYFTLQELEK